MNLFSHAWGFEFPILILINSTFWGKVVRNLWVCVAAYSTQYKWSDNNKTDPDRDEEQKTAFYILRLLSKFDSISSLF